MSGQNQQQGSDAPAATQNPAAGSAAPAADSTETTPKGFVPFFNEDYEFKLGACGDFGPALRLSIAFGFMLLTAGLLYCVTWWWVGIPPLGN